MTVDSVNQPTIRLACAADEASVWAILRPVIRAGETNALPRDMGCAEAMAHWMGADHETFVAESDRHLVGTYYIQANQRGGGAHVANCGYVTAPEATGRGVARAMCAHSLARARERGFSAMQFNLVVASNLRAVRLWHDMGFETVGRLPGAFAHPHLGYVDALVMYRQLQGV